jgi:hypothetical protein
LALFHVSSLWAGFQQRFLAARKIASMDAATTIATDGGTDTKTAAPPVAATMKSRWRA